MQFRRADLIFARDLREKRPHASLSASSCRMLLLFKFHSLGACCGVYTLLSGCASKRPHPHLCDPSTVRGSALSMHDELSPELVSVWPAKREETRLTPMLPCHKRKPTVDASLAEAYCSVFRKWPKKKKTWLKIRTNNTKLTSSQIPLNAAAMIKVGTRCKI